MIKYIKLRLAEISATFFIMTAYVMLLFPLFFFGLISISMVILLSFAIVIGFLLVSNARLWFKYRNKSIDENTHQELHSIVNDVSETFSLHKEPDIIIVNAKRPNAYAIDSIMFTPKIVITQKLIQLLNKNELESVIAHEASHISNNDSIFITSIGSMVSIFERIHNEIIKFMSISKLEFILFIIPFVIIRIILKISYISYFLISRVREYVADEDAAEYAGHKHTINALVKIHESNRKITTEKTVIDDEALCIIPISIDKSNLFRTHPKTEKRIKSIRKSFQNENS